MGQKRTRAGKFIHFCAVNLTFVALFGCAVLSEKQKVEVKHEQPPQKEEDPSTILSEHLTRAKKLLEQRDYDGSFRENQKILSLSGQNWPGDEALFNMGLIYAHSGNPKRDYGKSIAFFKRLMKDYPKSSFVVQARIWTGILQENEKLSQTIQKLNQVIEESKQVDIEIEERKRDKAK